MSKKNPATEEFQALPFEQALEKLEALVSKMETGNLPLEELILNFEAGSELAKVCRGKLDLLERKIELLTRDDGNNGQWTDFESNVPDTSRNAPAAPSEPTQEEMPF